MKKLIISLKTFGLIALCLTGCEDMSSAGHHTSPAYAVPGNVVWNGITYATRGDLPKGQLGHKLGVINDIDIKYSVYSVKGQKTTEEIAIEVHTPDMHYLAAVNKK